MKVVIITLLLLPLVLGLRSGRTAQRAALSAFVFVIYSLAWYAVLALELWGNSPDGTYGSDARYYWSAMLAVLNEGASPLDYSAPLYVYWGRLVLDTAPTQTVSWVIVSGILLAGNALMFLQLALTKALEKACPGIATRTFSSFYIAITLLNLNGVIVWMAIRGLKEPLILFVIALYVYLLESVSYRDSSINARALGSFLVVAASLAAFWVLNYLRPLGGALIFPYLMYVSFRSLLKESLVGRVLALLAITLVMTFTVPYLIERAFWLRVFQAEFGQEALQGAPSALFALARHGSRLALPLAWLRFVAGPGPIRALKQLLYGTVFQASTKTGDLLIFLGSMQWWTLLTGLLIIASLRPRLLMSRLSPAAGFLLLAVAIAGAYSFVYYGTGDTRHRALMYVFFNLPAALVLAQVIRRGIRRPTGSG
ncbi:MAG: hypothetical protein ACPLRM_00915 [Anaerolineae bacterium]